MSGTDPFEELIGRARALDEFAASIQAEYPSRVSNHDLRTFRDQYRAWYYSGRALLSEDLRRHFDQRYNGAKLRTSIKGFLDRSTEKKPLRRIKTIEKDPTSVNNWQTPYALCFRQPFEEQCDILREAQGRPPGSIDVTKLHPRIHAVSAKLFEDGHYRNAIFEACVALNDPVRSRTESTAADGTKLMQHAFSPKNPLLRASEDETEQQGMMWLFSGAMMGLRNPRGHQLNTDAEMTCEECLEWLGFLSALMKVIDRSEKVTDLSGSA